MEAGMKYHTSEIRTAAPLTPTAVLPEHLAQQTWSIFMYTMTAIPDSVRGQAIFSVSRIRCRLMLHAEMLPVEPVCKHQTDRSQQDFQTSAQAKR
jgi:hypothetical protein